MALALVKEDGSGKADANSYAAVADGDAYHEGHLYVAEWFAANPDKRAAALVMATRVIDSVTRFRGTLASDTQALQWPREGARNDDMSGVVNFPNDAIPKVVVSATIETARVLIKGDRTADPEGQGTRQVMEFGVKTVTYDPNDRRPILPPIAQAMLAKVASYIETPNAATAVTKLVRV